MPVYDAPLEPGGAEDDLDEEVVGSGKAPLGGSSRDDTRPRWLILKRRAQRMVLFQGWPEGDVLLAFQELRMTIGLALTADDFAAQRLIEGCGYVFIGADHRRAAVFATALRDLARANWSIDRDRDASWSVQDASWQVITGGYRPEAGADRRQPRSSEQQDSRERRKLQRMEA